MRVSAFSLEIMQFCILAVLTLFLFSCDDPSSRAMSPALGEEQRKTVFFQLPKGDTNVMARPLLWQRSYPEEYSELVRQAKQSRSGDDPFADPIEVPDNQLTPGTFGFVGWGRGLVSQVFDELGYPFEGEMEAYLEVESGLLRITHSPSAIEAFQARFPEFKLMPSEHDAGKESLSR